MIKIFCDGGLESHPTHCTPIIR